MHPDFHSYFTASSTKEKLIGVEFEVFNLDRETLLPISYYDQKRGVGRYLQDLVPLLEGQPIMEGKNILGINAPLGKITLEPGAQLEFSSHPRKTIRELDTDFQQLCERLTEVNKHYDYFWPNIAVTPFGRARQIPLIPKRRYEIMAEYFQTTGDLADFMMRATTSVQFNYSYSSEEDFSSLCRAASILSGLVPLLGQNAPFIEGHKAGTLSYRSTIWNRTDSKRCGFISRMVGGQIYQFSDYLDYALDIPLLFISRNGTLISTYPLTFGQFLRQEADVRLEDFTTHLNLLFPMVRPSNRIELRGHDLVSIPLTLAFCALYKGLFYWLPSRQALIERTRSLSATDLQGIYDTGAIKGFDFVYQGTGGRTNVRTMLEELYKLAEEGLKKLEPDESEYLEPLKQVLASGRTPAQALLDHFEEQGDLKSSILSNKLI